ncbi:MAG: conjugal transfer protein TraD [Holosporaceae bacterium]|jgi:hypothetical protein|nr:conjugal transfer protein TraD [Holosporaceae bacterium]
MKKQENKQRKARTRTLIQLGGLLDLTPLLSICDINLGDDLQLEYPDKAATLLGILSHFCKQLPEEISEEDLSQLKNSGVKSIKSKTMQ